MTEKTELRKEFQEKQKQINSQWKGIASTYPHAYKDLLEYLDGLKEMYHMYGEERSMPGPDGKQYSLDNDTIASLLQGARVCGMVKTYIVNRVDYDVAQPKKTNIGESK